MWKRRNDIIFDFIQSEYNRQESELELIASENYVSADILAANGSILTNKYSEWYPGKRYYAGQEFIDKIENLAIERAKLLFGAEYVNVQPLSWSPANLAAYLAVLNPGDVVLWLSLDQWWHLSHGHPLNFSGLLYNIVPYYLDKHTELIDMEQVEALALEHKPKMILAGFSAYSRNLDWKRFRQIADKVWAILMADIAHISWLIAWGVLENPVQYCDIVTTTTHKTLRWPRGAIIMSKQKYAAQIARAVFPWVQWWPHENLIAAKAIAFGEALEPEFKQYAHQVILNAQFLATQLQQYGFRIISWGTDNHLILVDVFWSFWVTGKEAEKALEIAWISTNKNMIPYDERKPLDPSWIRIGTPAVTTRGMKESEMKEIWKIFYQVILEVQKRKESLSTDIFENQDFLDILWEYKKQVQKLCKKFPIYS